MSYMLEPSPPWFPYFGNQRRVVPFVKELFIGLGAKEGDTVFETNAGSHAVSYRLALDLGMRPIANDLGFYSYNIGLALAGDRQAAHIAAKGAAIIEQYGYTPDRHCAPPASDAVQRWLDFIDGLETAPNYTAIRGDLFEEIERHSAKFIYCDFAWPWRDGSATVEYEVTADTFGAILGDTTETTFRVANGRRILQDVIRYLDVARQRYGYVILSNQSSNYPTPEVLEAHMAACGHTPIIVRTQTLPAEYVDNLGKSPFFTEYQYVFEGSKSERSDC